VRRGDGLEAAEEDSSEQTLVGAAGERIKHGATAGFERVRHLRPGFPLWLRFLTATFVIVASIAAAAMLGAVLPPGAGADAPAVTDCTVHLHLTHHYTVAQLQGAIATMSASASAQPSVQIRDAITRSRLRTV